MVPSRQGRYAVTQPEHGAEQSPPARARQALEHAYGEAADVLSFSHRGLRYKVPGRTRDGDRKDEFGPISRIFFAILGVPAGIAALFAGLFDPFELFGLRSSKVTGPAGCAALTPADAVQESTDSVFLVWSANHLALVACERGPARVVWQASHAQRPAFDPATGVMSWPDGSRIDFSIPSHERKRFPQSNSHR